MIKDDTYYDSLDKELTDSVPIIDMKRAGGLGVAYANIVALSPEDMTIAQLLASQNQTSVSDFLSTAIREQLALQLA